MTRKSKKVEQKKEECNMLCAYCWAKRSGKMMTQMTDYELEWGYYEDVEWVESTIMVDIYCEECKKLLYRKEIINKSYAQIEQ